MTGDYYRTLQLDPSADPEVVEAAYRRLARKWHPDTNDDPEAPSRMRQINEAYAVLSDPERRRGYDTSRGAVPAAGTGPRTMLGLVAAAALGTLLATRLLGVVLRHPVLLLLLAGGALGLWWYRHAPSRLVTRERPPADH